MVMQLTDHYLETTALNRCFTPVIKIIYAAEILRFKHMATVM